MTRLHDAWLVAPVLIPLVAAMAVGTETIRAQEDRHLSRAVAAWRDEPAIELGVLIAEEYGLK